MARPFVRREVVDQDWTPGTPRGERRALAPAPLDRVEAACPQVAAATIAGCPSRTTVTVADVWSPVIVAAIVTSCGRKAPQPFVASSASWSSWGG